jgi:Helix-turn-helix domain of resolvase
VLEREGVPRRYNLLTSEDVERALKLYEQGSSLTTVAERLGVSARTAHAALRQSGVAMRPVGTNQWT